MIKKPAKELINTWSTKPNDNELKIWEMILPIAETFLFKGGIEESQSLSPLSGEEEWLEDLEKLALGDSNYFPLHAMIRHSIDMSEINSVLTTEQYNIWQRFKGYLADKQINDLDRYYFEQLKKILKSNICEDNIIPYYMFIDTETTGRPEYYNEPASNTNNWPRLVQIAWLIYDRDCNLISENVKIIKPDGFLIPDEAIEIHNIDNNRANKEGEDLKEVLELLLDDTINTTAYVGHNIDFDLNIISSEFYRIYGFDPMPNLQRICTMKLSTNYCEIPGYRGFKWPTLNQLHKVLFSQEIEKAHDALVDIQATAKCFWRLKEIGVINNDDIEEGSDLPF